MGSSAARLWLPADWVDEINPTLLDSPGSFIERNGQGWALRLPADDPERDNEFYRTAIEPGQIIVFLWTEHHGDITVDVHPDGTFEANVLVPEATTHFYEYSSGILATSLADVVSGDDPLPAGQYEVSAYTWSGPIPFRFEADVDGVDKFVPCAPQMSSEM